MTAKVRDLFKRDEFAELLVEAEAKAKGDWEAHFIADVIERHEQYGDGMFLSSKQLAAVGRIAGMLVPAYPTEDRQNYTNPPPAKRRPYRNSAYRKPPPPDTGPMEEDSLDVLPW